MSLQQEQLRHQYLEAIGISSWLPRGPLPGAAPSADWVAQFRYPPAPGSADAGWDASGEEPDMEAEASAVGAGIAAAGTAAPGATAVGGAISSAPGGPGRASRAAALAELEQLAPPTSRPTAQSAPVRPAIAAERTDEPPAPAARPVASGPVPRFKLAFVLAGDLLIVDSLPPQSPQGFGKQHQRLLAGVLRAMNVTAPASEAALLSWPMLASTTLDQGAGEAQKAVQRKLNLTLETAATVRPVQRALLLGAEAARWILEREEELDALRGIRFMLRADLPCVSSCSLSQALQLPELKAELWKDLQVVLLRS